MSKASRLIRDSIAALPDDARKPWSKTETRNFYWVVSGEDGVARWGRDVTAPESEIAAIAAHVALFASPNVAAAVADLLDAIHDFTRVDQATLADDLADDPALSRYTDAVARVLDARDILEAAITRAGGL